MTKLSIISPWKQDRWFKEKEERYIKRLQRTVFVEITETKKHKGDNRESVKIEGEFILSKVKKDSFIVALVETGKSFDSINFSKWFERVALSGKSNIFFIVGGSSGLYDKILDRADLKLSLSSMTMPHQFARLFLIEQIYRAFTIINNEPYNK